MSIVEELKRNVFDSSSNFLDELASRRITLGRYQDVFLDLLAEELRRKLPNFKMIVSLGFKKIIAPSPRKPVELIGVPQDKIRDSMCSFTWRSGDCHSKLCFDGEFSKGTEIDASIIRDNKDFCLLEYENKRAYLCGNFMKIYWLQQLLKKQFESLFVTTLTSRKHEGTLDEFKRYIERARPFLNRLLGNWSILEIVDLSSEKRSLKWEGAAESPAMD